MSDPDLIVPVGDAGTTTCNALSAFSKSFNPSLVGDQPPEPLGGMIADGVYYLSKREGFVGSDAGTARRPYDASGTLVISGSTGLSADAQISWVEFIGELPLQIATNFTIMVRGTSFDYTLTCGNQLIRASSGSMPFTATANQLLWFYPDASGTLVDTFERQ